MKLAKHFGANRNSSMLCLICSSVHSVHCTLYSYRTNVHKLCSASSAEQLNNWSDHIIGGTPHALTDWHWERRHGLTIQSIVKPRKNWRIFKNCLVVVCSLLSLHIIIEKVIISFLWRLTKCIYNLCEYCFLFFHS